MQICFERTKTQFEQLSLMPKRSLTNYQFFIEFVMNFYLKLFIMPYVFPTPSQVPYEVKQKVMNHVYPKK
ncbi:TPA: hypothetical protein DIC40_00480 [Patescibacteria group bacterium]|nr:hypothetical protein [Candidatus Gracilibacteria bacterium]